MREAKQTLHQLVAATNGVVVTLVKRVDPSVKPFDHVVDGARSYQGARDEHSQTDHRINGTPGCGVNHHQE